MSVPVRVLLKGRTKAQSPGDLMRSRVRQNNSLALLSLLSLLWGCSDGTGEYGAQRKPQLVLGFSQVAAEANWDTANSESIRKAARDAGIDLRLEDAKRSQVTQMAALRSFVNQRVDVIAFSPVVETGWENVLREIRLSGIPVILMDRAIEINDESLYVSLVGSDFVEEGRRAGQWLLEHTRDLQGEIGVIELQGTVDSAPANGRNQGFFEVIAPDARYRLVRSASADFDRTRARELMAEFLRANGRRIHVVFAHSDTMALGAIEAIEAAGLNPGSDILVISIEGSRKGLEAIVAGKLNVTVECSPLLGPQLMTVVMDLAAHKPVPRRVITQESMFTRENAAAELPNRVY
jgi:ABC-type sugar transport system substrate-binding protein